MQFREKGDSQECKNYRSIKLLTHIFKICEKVVDKRMREWECTDIHERQFGFKPERRTTDAIFNRNKRAGQKDIILTFVYLKKAYDRVSSLPEKYVSLIQDMYSGCQTKELSAECENSSFNVDVHLANAANGYIMQLFNSIQFKIVYFQHNT